jgi:hypothetical protein
MCCFSRHVEKVWSTRIFARPLEAGRQLLVYGMSLEVASDVAMVVPIPVPPGSADDAVRFVDMSAVPTFFDDVSALFPVLVPQPASPSFARFEPQSAPVLVVHDVGDFEASFVPQVRDFARLDARFRLPEEVWEALPTYADWGFCVFKLKAPANSGRSGLLGLFKAPKPSSRKVHPMAFEFPRRDASQLFFPTVHVHDGLVHPTAQFDHELYCQTEPGWEPLMQWERSASRADTLAAVAKPWVEPSAWLYKRVLAGELPNRDTYLAEAKLRARTAVSALFRIRMRAAYEHVIDDGRAPLEPRVKKWMRVSEAERVRIREALAASLGEELARNRDAWSLDEFSDDGGYETFSASNERIEPQDVDVAFRAPPTPDVRAAVQAAVQGAIDRATR